MHEQQLKFRDRLGQRLGRCIFGLALFAIGISLQMNANIGAPPWDVFHQGVAKQTEISVGKIIVMTGFILLLLWIPLKQKPGLGTILNALEIGLVADLALAIIPEPKNIFVRVIMASLGIVIVAIGTGFYIGSALGPGPRDGLMTGLAKRGIPIRIGRTAIEVTVLVVGLLLGGQVGVATFAFALGVGPLVHFFLPRLAISSGNARP
ncbi:MAG: YczE/YyaS/YitT family protein [Ilumatobacteraceae bacterium]